MLSDADLLAHCPSTDLTALARVVRDGAHGRRVTYSPKVFIPLTMLCRDRCGYCTFAKAPARVTAPYLLPEEVLAIAEAGQAAGCHEALFTLGERPELRYPVRGGVAGRRRATPRRWTTSPPCAASSLEETGLLPHANAGALDATELATLRPVAASQGMMLESLAEGLDAHRGSPDKEPARRLATLEFAGELAIPFTTGILVGIGDDRADQLAALRAIAAVARPPRARARGHRAELPAQAGHGHVPGRALPARGPAVGHCGGPPGAAARRSTCRRRRTSPTTWPRCSHAGIDDWGGVSPVTADHVNPERAWPALDILREATEAAGHTLAPRLTVYPTFALDPARWLDPALRFPRARRLRRRGAGPRRVVVLGGRGAAAPAARRDAAPRAAERSAAPRPAAAPWPRCWPAWPWARRWARRRS